MASLLRRLCVWLVALAVALISPVSAYPPGPFAAGLHLSSAWVTPGVAGCVGQVTNSPTSVYTITNYVLSRAEVYDAEWGLLASYHGLPYYESTPANISPGAIGEVSASEVFASATDVRGAEWAWYEFYLIGNQYSDPMVQPTTSIFVSDWIEIPEPSSILALLCGLGGVMWRGKRRA